MEISLLVFFPHEDLGSWRRQRFRDLLCHVPRSTHAKEFPEGVKVMRRVLCVARACFFLFLFASHIAEKRSSSKQCDAMTFSVKRALSVCGVQTKIEQNSGKEEYVVF